MTDQEMKYDLKVAIESVDSVRCMLKSLTGALDTIDDPIMAVKGLNSLACAVLDCTYYKLWGILGSIDLSESDSDTLGGDWRCVR